MTRADLARINRERTEQGEEPYANPRNLTAGSLKLLDPKLVRRPQAAPVRLRLAARRSARRHDAPRHR